MKAVVLGAGGMLGRALVETAPADLLVVPFEHSELDITDERALREALVTHQPAIIVNAAAYTAVDRAEDEPERAFGINADAVTRLGYLAASLGARVVHFSTDYIFDGDSAEPYEEDAVPRPLNVYGRSKLQGERGLQASGATSLIIRTQWLFGPHGRCFPVVMWQRALAGSPTQVVQDQIGRPTYTIDLAGATWALIHGHHTGLFHVTNEGMASWFTFAARVFDRAGVRDLLTPCRTADFPRIARRPPYSTLATTKLRRTLGRPLPNWETALQQFLASMDRPS